MFSLLVLLVLGTIPLGARGVEYFGKAIDSANGKPFVRRLGGRGHPPK